MIRFVRGSRPLPQTLASRLSKEGFTTQEDAAHRWLVPGDALAEQVSAARACGARAWVVVKDLSEIASAVAAGGDLWLVGLEGAGPCGSLGAIVLLRAASASGRDFVIEGLSVRAMAAAVAVGAAGIVIDAALWLTKDMPLDETSRALIQTASSGHDTTIEGEFDGHHVRKLTRGSQSMAAPQNIADAKRYDGWATLDAARAVAAEVEQHLAKIAELASRTEPDETWSASGIVQGPMANISEGTGLARAVRAAGAMPFAALGALDEIQAAFVLQGFVSDVDPPWGVGVIGFDVMPHRDAHLAAIAALGARGPSVVTLAGANIGLALALGRQGMNVWMHTPSGRLCEQALTASVPGVILEGHEAGGHVGKLTSVGLWEDGLAAAERCASAHVGPNGKHMPTVVLAGGIGDAVSAAFARAMAARASALGVRVLLQAGTAFLLTHEAAESGQVTPIYQSRALMSRDTVLVGSTINLPLRCAPNAFTDEARAQEIAWESAGMPRAERRLRIEHHNLGRTRIAAKGIERDPTHTVRYRPVPAMRQDREGAFTVGQGAAVTARIERVSFAVDAMTRGAKARLVRERPASPRGVASVVTARLALPQPRETRPASRVRPVLREGDIAIIGVGCVLPGALDVPSFLHNLVVGIDSVGPIPPERWAEHRYYDPDAGAQGPAKSYSRHAGAVRGFRFDPLPFRIPPKVVATMDPSQRLALAAAAEAVRSAGLDGSRGARLDKRRAGVVLGNAMGGEFAKHAALRVRFREVLDVIARDEVLEGCTVEEIRELEARVEEELATKLPPVDVESMAGLLSNVVAGRVAAWLDWMGGNLTVDAACAASLAALSVAVDWLRLGRCDVVLTGGVDTDLAPESYVGFCRTHALSRTGSSPFSAHADGFVMGEGAAAFVLKRKADALRDGDDIWAVIRGVGVSSDGRGRGITAPRAEGQALAIRRAYEEAALQPSDIGMVEAHGTGTSLGDATEVSVLAKHFADSNAPVWLGSVKSMIGHLKSAAGAASLLKATLALRTGIVPPTLHAGPLESSLGLSRSPFRLPRRAVALPEDRPRASVSAFGFGGTNYHVLLEAHRGPMPRAISGILPAMRASVSPDAIASWKNDDITPILVAYGAETLTSLRAALSADRPCDSAVVAARPHRLVVLLRSPEDSVRQSVLSRVSRWLDEAPRSGATLGREAFYGEGPAVSLMLAFPGQGAPRDEAVSAVTRLPTGARAIASMDEAVRAQLGDTLSLGDRASLSDPVSQHAVLYAASVAWSEIVTEAKLPVAGVLGHSLGAYAALVAADAVSSAALLPAVLARGKALQSCPEGAMVAVHLPSATPQTVRSQAQALASQHALSLAAINGASRVSLSGPSGAVLALARELGAAHARILDVQRAYHSPLVAGAVVVVRDALSQVHFRAPRIPVWSARTASLLEGDIQSDLVDAISEPVLFDPAVRAVAAGGQGLVWLELGPGTTASRIAEAAGEVAIPLDGGEQALAVASAWLLALGHPGLCALVPGSWLVKGLPAVPLPEPIVQRAIRPSSARPNPAVTPPMPLFIPSDALAARADRLVDLRIASLADPTLTPLYTSTRAALLHDLADSDASAARGHIEAAHATPVDVALARAEAASAPARPAPAQPAQPETEQPETEQPETEQPETVPLVSGGDLRAGVLSIICEVTGYPPDLVTDDADLEGELGIDSIRKMEILGLLEQRYGFTTSEADYIALADANLAALTAHVQRQSSSGGPHREVHKADVPAGIDGEDSASIHLSIQLLCRMPPIDNARPEDRFGTPPIEISAGRDPEDVLIELSEAALAEPIRAVVATDAGGRAAAAFLRCAAREIDCGLRLVHLQDGAPREEIPALLDSAGQAEIVVGPDAIFARVPLEVALPDEPLAGSAALPHQPVLLVTGGVRGIVIPCLRGLRDLEPRVVILSRTAGEQARASLAQLEIDGLQISHIEGDVTVLADVVRAAAEARARYGRIDGVIHAAGLLRDGLLGTVHEDDLRLVMRTKWTGANNLIEATATDDLRVFCTFSSLVSWLGNPAQTAYAAANAAMESLRHPRALRTVSLAWTAWSEIGMAAKPPLLALLASRGVRALSPAQGAQVFRRIVLGGMEGAVAVSADALPGALQVGWPLRAPIVTGEVFTFPIPLDPLSGPLADHKLGRRPLVPAALWFAALLEAAKALSQGEAGWTIEQFEVLAPTFVERLRGDVFLTLAPAPDVPKTWVATIAASDTAVCRARLVPCEAQEDSVPLRPLLGAESAGGLYRPDLLFHGPVWQVLERTRTENGSAEADVLLGRSLRDGASPVARAVDGIHQLLTAWSGRQAGWLGLPIGADRWIASGAVIDTLRIETHTTASSSDELSANVVARDSRGRVVLRGEGVRLRAARRGIIDA